MEKETSRKLTDEEKQKVIFVANDILSDDLPDEPTEYDVLMKQKVEEFTLSILTDDNRSSLLEMCEEHFNRKGFISGFSLVVQYDMWLNKSWVWPVKFNPEWEEWNKLREKG